MARKTAISLVIGTIAGAAVYLPSLPYFKTFGRFGDTDLVQAMLLQFDPTPVSALLLVAGALLSLRQWRRNRYVRIVSVCVLLPVLLSIVQYAITGRTLYARNFLYLVPLMCIAAAMALRWRRALAMACCIGALVVVSRLRQPYSVDFLAQAKRLWPDLQLGCCVREPVEYEVEQALPQR